MKKILTNTRIIILLVFLLLSLVAINPHFSVDGVAIRQVLKNSPAELAGIPSPTANVMPTQREIITAINGIPITDDNSYYNVTSQLIPNQSVIVQTNKQVYRLMIKSVDNVINNDSVNNMINNGNNLTTNITNITNITNTSNKLDVYVEKNNVLGINIYNAPTTNIRKGLDLSGGTRVVLKPEHKLIRDDLDLIIANIKERLNVFGLSDIVVRSANDLNGDQYIIVEIAGANKNEVRELLSNQGVFQAKVGNATIFNGGNDITFVCRSPDCSGIDTRSGGCQPSTDGGYACRFSFSISLSDEAAKRQANATAGLTLNKDNPGYLSEPIDLYLDGDKVDSLQIAADLKGRALNDIQISGSGKGSDYQSALADTLANMKKLQTILITGSLPVKLKIVKTDGISPLLGAEFIKNALLMALLAIISVAIVVFIRYRKFSISLPMLLTMLSEGIIILGFASFVGWNLDLAAIAGIIIAVGTGVDDQIVIIDETIKGMEESIARSWKERMKRAFFIIFASYATTVVAMLPLWFAGAGLLRGFAITTIVGVTVGVFVTRPAFAAIVEYYIKKKI